MNILLWAEETRTWYPKTGDMSHSHDITEKLAIQSSGTGTEALGLPSGAFEINKRINV